jgi:hypothetical protein
MTYVMNFGFRTLVEQNFCFAQLIYDLLRCESSLGHFYPFFEIITGILFGGHVRWRVKLYKP